jgi:hypothetical protein
MVASIDYLRRHSRNATTEFVSPFFQQTKQSYQFRSDITATAIAGDYLAIVVGRDLLFYGLNAINWHQPHRRIPLAAQPQHLLLAGIDSRYIITITAQSRYEVWDRVSANLVSHGFFPQWQCTQYQVINQQYILAAHDSSLDLYSLTDLTQPLKTLRVKGEILDCQFHASTRTLYCAAQQGENLLLSEIAMSGAEMQQTSLLPTYPMRFVGLSVSSSTLLLQAITREGQLRVMTFDLPGLRLESTVEKSPAYYGATTINPAMPWAMTNLGNGVLIWDIISHSPIGLIESPVSQAIQCQWVDIQSFVLTHGPMIELWHIAHTPYPYLESHQPLTALALDDFKSWMQNQPVGVSILLGEAAIGKSAIVQAYIGHRPNALYVKAAPNCDELTLLKRLLEVLSTDFNVESQLPIPELQSVLRAYLHDFDDIVLDQFERLDPMASNGVMNFLDTTSLRILLVTTAIPDIDTPTYRCFPIEERLDWPSVSRFFAPTATQYQFFVESIKPNLEQAARHYRPAFNG